jgi:DNA polymerase IV
VQQIGLKYYDELLLKIPRLEVESIASTILKFTRELDSEYQMIIVGGYRRGKKQSGDVDVILSHPSDEKTLNLVKKLALRLERSAHIKWVLSLSTKNSERGQRPVPWRGEGGRGSGFDTLDKALVVWKNPEDKASPHRRVDIIVSPWRTVGCAVLGWSGGTTFQRDLRRYCKKERNLKFDSSGIRSRADGAWVDIEDGDGVDRAKDMVEAEKRVFQGLELEYRPPEERCTG